MSRSPRRLLPLALAASLLLATLLAYSSLARNGFVHIDDNAYVTDNPHVQAGLAPETFAWAFTTSRAANWHPLTWLSHALDCELFGLDPRGHHLTSLAFHAATTLWLFFLLLRATGAAGRSAFVAALFALHPLHVESVAWVAERKDVLAGFFFVATVWAYLRWVERAGVLRYAFVLASYALGLMAKPMLVTLPFVLLLLDAWPLGRLSEPWPRLREKIPLLLLAAGSSAATFLVQRAEGAMTAGAGIPLGSRIENAIVSYVAYLGQTVRPAGLAIFYPHPRGAHSLLEVAGCALLLLAISAVAWHGRKERPYLAVGWLWYLGMLAPVIGIVQVGAQARGDRYTYLPLIGISIAVGWWAVDLAGRLRPGRAVLATTAVLLAGAWAILTHRQVAVWRNDLSLFEREVELLPNDASAHGMLGKIHLREGRLDEAVAEFRIALELEPKYGEGHSNYGMALELQGERHAALAEYAEAVRCQPDLIEARVNLGRLLDAAGKREAAIEHLEAAVRLDPERAEAHHNLAVALLGAGRIEEAIAHLERAIDLQPGFAAARKALDIARARRGSG